MSLTFIDYLESFQFQFRALVSLTVQRNKKKPFLRAATNFNAELDYKMKKKLIDVSLPEDLD